LIADQLMSFWAAAMRLQSHKNPRQVEQREDHPSYTRTRFRVHEQKAALANVERTIGHQNGTRQY